MPNLRENYFTYLNYKCENIEDMKSLLKRILVTNERPGIFLTKGESIIESGFVVKGKKCSDAYIPYYLNRNEIESFSMDDYERIIKILIRKYKKSLVEDKIKEIQKDFE